MLNGGGCRPKESVHRKLKGTQRATIITSISETYIVILSVVQIIRLLETLFTFSGNKQYCKKLIVIFQG